MFKILCPIDKKERGGDGTYWMRMGTAYPNRDDSINLYLDAYPINGRLQLREMDEEDFQRMDEGRARKRESPVGPTAMASPINDLPF
jgi:hypothetical protein